MEIEKKFLVKTLPNLSQFTYKQIAQAYIATDPVIRIRQMNEDYYLTIKSKGHLTREEYEMPITHMQYTNLLPKVSGHIIQKKRYYIPLAHHLTAELDVFEGDLTGLVTVEVEFENEEAAINFAAPEWFGRDITFEAKYKNNSLAIHGLKTTTS